jgi:hypothetical protein
MEKENALEEVKANGSSVEEVPEFDLFAQEAERLVEGNTETETPPAPSFEMVEVHFQEKPAPEISLRRSCMH